MGLLWVLSILLGLAASTSLENAEEWQMWKAQHGKWYLSWGEEMERHRVWLTNREFIENHNKKADVHGYSLALNHFGDLVLCTAVTTASQLGPCSLFPFCQHCYLVLGAF